ncbi:hypothetical protein QQF64_030105, partial [Cirrhinus molitorella]
MMAASEELPRAGGEERARETGRKTERQCERERERERSSGDGGGRGRPSRTLSHIIR